MTSKKSTKTGKNFRGGGGVCLWSSGPCCRYDLRVRKGTGPVRREERSVIEMLNSYLDIGAEDGTIDLNHLTIRRWLTKFNTENNTDTIKQGGAFLQHIS